MKARIVLLSLWLAICPLLVLVGCKAASRPSDSLQSRLDQYCSEKAGEDGTKIDNVTKSDAFFSPKAKTCVKVEVTEGKDWSYNLSDLTHNFMRGPQLIESEQPLTVFHHEHRTFKSARAEGFWKATSSDEGKQLVDRIAVSIECNSNDRVCREHQAAILMGVVKPDSVDYRVSRWDDFGIIADTDDDLNECQTSHRLTIDFPTNNVKVTDYAKNSTGNCKQMAQDANAYSLHGGSIMFYGQYGIFSCDESGINSVIVDKVEKFQGDVGQKNYADYMDDGAGGQPSTIKTPAQHHTPEQCQKAMDSKIRELKGF